jgi:cold shock CspA family protein
LRSFKEGWGFVQTDDGKDHYFHEKTVQEYGGDVPPVGTRVTFSTVPDNQKRDKVMAVALQSVAPAPGTRGASHLPPPPPAKRPREGPSLVGPSPSGQSISEAYAMGLSSTRLFQLAELKMREEVRSGRR